MRTFAVLVLLAAFADPADAQGRFQRAVQVQLRLGFRIEFQLGHGRLGLRGFQVELGLRCGLCRRRHVQ